jgi:hypothetical protein
MIKSQTWTEMFVSYSSLELAAGHRYVARVDECKCVYQTGKATTDQWTNNVDPEAREVSTGDSRAEGAGWVHGPTREGASSKDIGTDNESNSQGGDGAEISLLRVSSSCIHSVYEAKGDNNFKYYPLKCTDSSS